MKYTFFKINRYKRFDFIPRYYDPIKEDLERRVDMAKSDLRRELREARIKDKMQGYRRYEHTGNSTMVILVRRFGIAGVLILLFWLVLEYGHIFEAFYYQLINE